jgi:hypothetical protein
MQHQADAWPELARAIIELDKVDFRAKQRWLELFVIHRPFVYFIPDTCQGPQQAKARKRKMRRGPLALSPSRRALYALRQSASDQSSQQQRRASNPAHLEPYLMG